jgi:hypothetical protein
VPTGYAAFLRKNLLLNRRLSVHWDCLPERRNNKMPVDYNTVRQCIKLFDFTNLFIEQLGWDFHTGQLNIMVDNKEFILKAVAEKRGMAVYLCSNLNEDSIPDYNMRRKIEREVTKTAHEHLIIYVDKNNSNQIWQWVKREPGKPLRCREHSYNANQPGDALIQKLPNIAFTLEEEEALSIIDVTSRSRTAFDIERVTKRFYDRFKAEHANFLKFIKGIPEEDLQRWYASIMLNRLMFIYFIQKKSFLNNDVHYLHNKLNECKKDIGKDCYYSKFLNTLFFEGFAKKQDDRSFETNHLLGEIPYLNGGLFLRHSIEEKYGKNIEISDTAFEKLFEFFDAYQWHLDERPLHWFIEFYGIIKKGGFDVIIGNPPYVEYSKVMGEYTIKGYETEDCGNLYAYIVERALNLLKEKGRFGMIVPISLPSTPRMFSVRDLFHKNSNLTWCSNFADRPGTLFNGVHQKLSIIISKKDIEREKHSLFTTSYKHWYQRSENNERNTLMESLEYISAIVNPLCWLKSGNLHEQLIYDKLKLQHHSITRYFQGSSTFSLNMRMMYWGKCFTELQKSNEYKNFKVSSETYKKIMVALFNSSLYFWFWELISDGWHITSKELDNFFINLEIMNHDYINEISKSTDELMKDIDSKKVFVGTKQTDYEYYHKLSKPLIDQIDRILALHYGFTDEELDFIINYDIKYRMGQENQEEEE